MGIVTGDLCPAKSWGAGKIKGVACRISRGNKGDTLKSQSKSVLFKGSCDVRVRVHHSGRTTSGPEKSVTSPEEGFEDPSEEMDRDIAGHGPY